MSALVYYNKHLTGDFIGQLEDDRIDTYCHINKIFKSKHEDAFIGVVGREILDNHQELIDLSILSIYGKINTDQRQRLGQLTSERSIILLTKDAAYSFNYFREEFRLLKSDRVNCWGNGQIHVTVAMHYGLNVVEAIGVYHRVSYGIPRTKRTEHITVSQHDCRPIDLTNYLPKEETNE